MSKSSYFRLGYKQTVNPPGARTLSLYMTWYDKESLHALILYNRDSSPVHLLMPR